MGATPIIGESLRRKEDHRFLTGAGTYTDDIRLDHQTYAVFVRSPHAHARIVRIDTARARHAPGVIAVFTGEDTAASGAGGVPCGWLITDINGQPMKEPPHPALAQGKVRHVGDQVAVVIAESLDAAQEACELLEVEYEVLPAVVNAADAGRAGAAVIHDAAPDNTCYVWAIGDKGAVDKAFASAAHVTRLDLVNNRIVPNAIEPRCVAASYSRSDDSSTVYVSNQNPHVERLLLSSVLGLAEHKLRVIAPDVGGGFGSKIFLYPEDVVVTWASRQINRPVKWTAERGEAFLSDAHARDHVTAAELALDAGGRFLALRVRTTANLGAYLSTFGSCLPAMIYAPLLAGQYSTPAIYGEITAVFTNTVPVDAYRGAGQPEATYVVERLVETAARELGIAPAELRRRNFITQFPYQTPLGLVYDVGDYNKTLDSALRMANVAEFPARKAEATRRGMRRGLGYCCYVGAGGSAPSHVVGALGGRAGLYESAEVRVHPTGKVSVFTGSHSHGQGHETTFAQIVAGRLGIPVDDVEIVHGDTGRILFGMGTYGSRSLAVGGTALVKAIEKVIAKGRKIAAHLMEAADSDIEFEDGNFQVAGTDRRVSFAQVALAAYVPHNYPIDKLEPGLNEQAFYDPLNSTFPAGSHVCEVEVDPDTGVSRIVGYTAVDDFGNIINPLIVAGQVHGGLAQGIGQALVEGCRYDERTGQLLTGSYLDYVMPRAADLPEFTLATEVTPCTHNPLGAKGCGESGTIAAAAAVMNALTDAIGVRDLEMPATPERVWRALRNAGAGS